MQPFLTLLRQLWLLYDAVKEDKILISVAAWMAELIQGRYEFLWKSDIGKTPASCWRN